MGYNYKDYVLDKYLDDLLKVYNYIDGIIVTNKDGYIQHYNSFRPDLNIIKGQETIGKHILDIYPELTSKTSTIMRVLATGEHIYDEYQEVISYQGEKRYLCESTVPIRSNGEIIGAVNISRYVVPNKKMQDIIIPNPASTQNKNPLNHTTKSTSTIDEIISISPEMEALKNKIIKIADLNTSVLIYGETGTGKDLFAQSLHSHSSRSNKPYVYQNCSAIPEQLLESMLFGVEKGAYTGALDKKGLFEIAQGGTIFLDEINSMDLSLQPKLLSAIEKKNIRKVGSSSTIDIDVRIIAATNEDPRFAIKSGHLRQDLFFRLSSLLIEIPPLRNRTCDIPIIANHFLNKFSEEIGKKVKKISEDTLEILLSHQWDGNVRELKNVIESAIIFSSSDTIVPDDVPSYLCLKKLQIDVQENTDAYTINHPKMPLKERLDQLEKRIIIEEIKKERNLSKAAQNLGISRQSLNYKLKKHKV